MSTEQKSFNNKELAELLKVDVRTLWLLRKNRLIGFIKVGNRIRYLEKHVEEYLRRQEHKARSDRRGSNLVNLDQALARPGLSP